MDKGRIVYTFSQDREYRDGIKVGYISVYWRDPYCKDGIGTELFTVKFQRNAPGDDYKSLERWYGFRVDALSLDSWETDRALKLLGKFAKGKKNLKSFLRCIKGTRYVHSSWIGETSSFNGYWIPRKATRKASAYHAAQLAGVVGW